MTCDVHAPILLTARLILMYMCGRKYKSIYKLNSNNCDGILELKNQIYLRRQHERGLMQKARRLMEENSVSFQMFLILLSSITLGSESQIPVFKEGRSNTWKSVLFCFFVRGEHAQEPKKNFIRLFARFNFSHLSLALILKYYPILHAVKR